MMLSVLSACSPVTVLNALVPKAGIKETRDISYAPGDPSRGWAGGGADLPRRQPHADNWRDGQRVALARAIAGGCDRVFGAGCRSESPRQSLEGEAGGKDVVQP
jgi:hypothetical protein